MGTLPIVLYGNQEQKLKYLQKLASGEVLAAYCLTEPDAGSDAINSCRSRAELSPDGRHYVINREKQFITNGAWADLFIVFAKIDGKHFSAFIVERGYPGGSSGQRKPSLGCGAVPPLRSILMMFWFRWITCFMSREKVTILP